MLKTSLILFTVLGAACAGGKDDAKGVVDDSSPPSIPSELGKADGSSKEIPIDVQSAHPYTNNLSRVYSVPLTGLPSCASSARVHFKVLRTEPSYDFVLVEPTGAPSQSFDGAKDGTWSAWFDLHADHVNVRLESDGSVTRHGFEIDKVEWNGGAICPAIAWPACGAGTVELVKPVAVCGCPQQPVCAPLAQVQVSHTLARGHNVTTNAVTGATASETHPGPTDAPQTTQIGTIDLARLGTILRDASQAGLFQITPYDHTVAAGTARETLHVVAGSYDVTFVSGEGTHDPRVAKLVADFEALFTCDGNGGVTCGNGFACEQSVCAPVQGCVCTDNFDPVCGNNGHTYSNACAAGCANAPVAHNGACGIAGDSCGTIFGLTCQDGYKCRFGVSKFEYPFPDAGGSCVAATYCDAAADCAALVHPATVGAWACETNACAWKTGNQWQSAGTFESAHPYASSTSVWKEVYLPATAQALRLVAISFALERNYDYLEVWSWKNNAWALDKRYTGTTAPAITDEFAGRYHYLRFVSDSSVNDQGFRVDLQWR